LLVSEGAIAQLGATVPNWTVPGGAATASPGKIHALGDVTNPSAFIGVAPCRIVDTRGPAGPYGAPPLSPGGSRNFALLAGPCAGLPLGVAAYSLNITVTNTQGTGFIKVYPQGGSAPVVSTLNFVAAQTLANAAIVPAGTGGGITVVAGVAGTDLIIDINGYFPGVGTLLAPGEYFGINGTYNGGAVVFAQQNSSSPSSTAVVGILAGSGDDSSGMYGSAVQPTGKTYGVKGFSFSGATGSAGVFGVDSSGDPGLGGIIDPTSGVRGASKSGYGVFGSSTDPGNGVGVKGVVLDSAGNVLAAGYLGETGGMGVRGLATPTTGSAYGIYGNATPPAGNIGYGVYGLTLGTAGNSAGLSGVGPHGFAESFVWTDVGTRGDDGFVGVLGTAGSGGIGVLGATFDITGANRTTEGLLGFPGATNYGLYAFIGTIGCNGCAKLFVEPHPTDATRVIKFVSIEANEALTAFRGSGHTVGGRAVIEVPAEFRAVTEQDRLTVQLTPMGVLATMAVEGKSLDRITVLSSHDVDFDYEIHGVHLGYRNFQSVSEGIEYAPRSPDDRMPAAWPEHVKQRLIANGTYNADGTVNMTTAERVGWAENWRKAEEKARSEARRVPLEPN
jgi:hypothetical protein